MYKIICILFLFLVSCGKSDIKKIDNTLINTDSISVYVPQGELESDCGITPYMLAADQMFTKEDQWYEVQLRFVKIAKEKEPETTDLTKINLAIDRLNKDFVDVRLTFKAAELTTVEDKKAYREGIDYYREHGLRYSERGYINIFIYPSTLGGFAGAAGGIPSTYIAIKEYYLPSSTISHEMGHALMGLFHTHTKDKSDHKHSYDNGDYVCETPRANFFVKQNMGFLGRVTDDCGYIGPPTGLSEEENVALINNIMSYSSSECRKSFYKDQIARGHFIINNAQDLKDCLVLIDKPI